MEVKEVYQQLEKQFPGKVGDFKGDVPEPYCSVESRGDCGNQSLLAR